MQIPHSIPPKQEMLHPSCPDCGMPMLLARIEPYQPDYDKRTFECQACLKEVIKIVKYK